MNNKNNNISKNDKPVLLELRDLVRLSTVLFFVPWFGWITTGLFGFELEFEAEIAVLVSFLIFGTFWCGWLCPFGNVSYFINKIGTGSGFEKRALHLNSDFEKSLAVVNSVVLATFL